MNSPSRLGRNLLLGAIKAYQAVRAGRLSPCRFVPSCSQYAAEAVELHGSFRGSCLAIRRVSRCRPLGGRGFDPVPAGRITT